MKLFRSKIGLELVLPLSALFTWMLYDMVNAGNCIGTLGVLAIMLLLGYFLTSIRYTIEKEIPCIKIAFLKPTLIEIPSIRKIDLFKENKRKI